MSTITTPAVCAPRFATQRNPERQTLGPAVGAVAKKLGKPFMPWQQLVADVAMEIDPATGRLYYDEIGLTVPRQSGKSTLVLAKATHRCSATKFFGPKQNVVYTAQTRNKAREKWQEDYADTLLHSPVFRSRVSVHLGNGAEHMRFTNRSRWGIEANTEKAGHGGTLDEAYIDEAFAQQDTRLEQAFGPAMITRANKQLWWVSTAGWLDGSPYLLAKVERARRMALGEIDPGRAAYFEWSAPDDADPADESVWWDCMPALGHTITVESIRGQLAKMADNLADFRRAYLNQWVVRDADATVFDLEVWAALRESAKPPPIVTPVALMVDMTPDRSRSTVALVGGRPDGVPRGEIVRNDAGSAWVVADLIELATNENVCGVALDPAGPAGSLISKLHQAGFTEDGPFPELHLFSTREMAQACGDFYDDVNAGLFRHMGDPLMSAAIGAAKKRPTGDAWLWSRKDLTDISPLVAMTGARAHWLNTHASTEPEPFVAVEYG